MHKQRYMKLEKHAQLAQLAQLAVLSAYTVIKERFLKLKIVGLVGLYACKLGGYFFRLGELGGWVEVFRWWHLF